MLLSAETDKWGEGMEGRREKSVSKVGGVQESCAEHRGTDGEIRVRSEMREKRKESWQRGEKGNKMTEATRHGAGVTQRRSETWRVDGRWESGWWERWHFIIQPSCKSNKPSIGLSIRTSQAPQRPSSFILLKAEVAELNSTSPEKTVCHHGLLTLWEHPGIRFIKYGNRNHFLQVKGRRFYIKWCRNSCLMWQNLNCSLILNW